MLTFYGYPRCSTCRNAAKWLDGRGIAYDAIDITQEPPPAGVLTQALRQGYRLRDLFNTSGQAYRQMNLKDRLPGLDEAEAIDLLTGNGMVCKRPVVTDGQRVTVGFKPEVFEETWGGGAA